MKLVILADDFTGANDTGVQFSKNDLTTLITTNYDNINPSLLIGDVLVINTESRFDSPETSYNKIFGITKSILQEETNYIYKKIDSTFRGNIGVEFEALLDSTNRKNIILAPALPINGRITKNGKIYLHNELLENTELALDPRNPMNSSDIREILAEQTNIESVVYVKNEEYTVEKILKWLKSHHNNRKQIFIFDAIENKDLEIITKAIYLWEEPSVLAGSAGLASYLPYVYDFSEKKGTLSVVGSLSKVSRRQIDYVQEKENTHIITIKTAELIDSNQWNIIISKATKLLKKGFHVILTTENRKEKTEETTSVNSEQISISLGKIAKYIIEESMNNIKGIFLTGGDTLKKVTEALEIEGMTIHHEVIPTIPEGRFLSEFFLNIPVVTKAGGFGQENTLDEILNYFKGL